MKTIALVNQKGGCGKTTTAINTAKALQQSGNKVLLIDADAQEHLTDSLGIDTVDRPTVYELLKGEVEFSKVVINVNGLDVIPGSLDLAGIDIEFAKKLIGGQTALRKALKDVNGYDYVLIDCPPALNIATINALVYAQSIIIILQTEYLSMKGMGRLLEVIEDIKEEGLNSNLTIKGVLCTMYDNRRNLDREVFKLIKEEFGDLVFNTTIRKNVSLAEAPAAKKTIFEYAPESLGAQDYKEFAAELIGRFPNG